MSTEKQQQANRQNAQKSTGPKTEEGKARSAQNAITHGAFAKLPCLPGEDPVNYQSIADQVYAAFPPTTPEATLLVDQLIVSLRTLHRLMRIEHGLFTRNLAESYREEAAYYRNAAQQDPQQRQRMQNKANDYTRLAEACQHAEETHLANAFDRGNTTRDPFLKLQRYITTTQRRIDRTIRTLQQLQNEPILPNQVSAITTQQHQPESNLRHSPPPGLGEGRATDSTPISEHPSHVNQPIQQNEPKLNFAGLRVAPKLKSVIIAAAQHLEMERVSR